MFEWKGNYKKLHYKFLSGIVKDVINYEETTTNAKSNNETYLFNNLINTKLYLNKNITINNNFNLRYEVANANGLTNKKTRFNNSWLLGVSQKYNRISIDVINRFLIVGDEQKPFAPNVNILFQLLKVTKI